MSQPAEIPCDLILNQREASQFDWGNVQRLSMQVAIAQVSDEDYVSIVQQEQDQEQEQSPKEIIRVYSGTSAAVRKPSIIVEFRTDARPNPLTLTVPWDSIGGGAHSLFVSYNGYSVRFYVDGVLVDEDWPMGSLPLTNAVIKVGDSGDKLSVWKNAITPERPSTQLEDQYLGVEPTSIQYWKPRGHNTGVGDCMPFFDGERFRLFYLYDRRGHASKWSLGAHQWAQISTRDFKSWEHHPMAVAITADWEGSICTGSIIVKDHTYYAYFAVRATDGSPAKLSYATSTDGSEFRKSEQYIGLSTKYSLASVRDPHVFRDEDGLYHMLITTSLLSTSRNQGCLAHLTSADLVDWTEQEPFIVPGYHDEPECSDYFQWDGWYYLIFSNDGVARYRYSREPMGPWLRPAMDVFDCVQWRVPKTAAYHDGRRMAAGFLSTPDRYAGELVIRELVQHADGTLGFKPMPELAADPIALHEIGPVALSDFNGLIYRDIEFEGAADLIVSCQATPENRNLYYGLSIAGPNGFEDGHTIRFDPSRRKVGIHRAHCSSLLENEAASIYEVPGLHETTSIEAVIKQDWIDLCVNGNRTLISRFQRQAQAPLKLRLYAQFGSVAFDDIRIGELA
ncbi:glycosyl hydrolase [Paenibacillus lignilyticus]|uniref:beta-fructofuranosidase n=1 Tax=Paenibacillus lignilyticus TaxID=1172615 RepID=A0ABS5CFD9_9BACL|nr:glycosyl hydrolase [Paenibacillus lignilyticus]MBP3964593.1 glycosyl hydrolase [Paenibacillus lignilyticus]